MEPVIQVRDLQKTYQDGTHAVQGVSFEVRKGEIFGLLGPNGAGKTTTMHILGTLHHATGGAARVLGHDVGKQAGAIRRRIGFAMQEVGIDDLATAEEMLVFHARIHGISKAEAKKRAAELLRTFDLSQHARRRVSAFSGGMQRRLDLAVSIIHEPDVLFLDEPTTGLDPQSRQELWDVLRRLRRDKGLTVIMSTHYMEEADKLCDRIAIMAKGRIAAIDTPEGLKRSVGADTIDVAFNREPTDEQRQRLRHAFRKVPSRFDDGHMHIQVPDGGASLLPALRIVDQVGLGVRSTKVVTPTLDDAFLRYTGERLGEEGSL
ncbi:MAG: ATP-binding cassette domain-containing protein [Thermoplasmatota archaeon]